jgi:hypothetical protein
MATFLPFNQNPTAVEIKTTSYTVPSTQYARVTVTNFEIDFQIDSVIAVEAVKYIGVSASSTIAFTNTSAYTLGGAILDGGSATAKQVRVNTPAVVGSAVEDGVGSPFGLFDPNNNGSATTFSVDACSLWVPQDCIVQTNSTATYEFHFTAIKPPTKMVFWVPSSTDLDGSRYVVELFNNP